jgi:DNA replication regulator SLD3
MGSQPMVLVARLDDGRALYAVEREDRGLYVLCQLGSWVNLSQLRAAAVVSKVELPRTTDKHLGEKDNIAVPLITAEASKYSKKKRLAIEAIQSMVKRPSTGLLTESHPSTVESEPLPLSQNEGKPSNDPAMNDVSTQLTAAEIFESVRTQYLEALYSKASVTTPLLSHSANITRLHWHILQKDLCQEPAPHFIWTMILRWI